MSLFHYLSSILFRKAWYNSLPYLINFIWTTPQSFFASHILQSLNEWNISLYRMTSACVPLMFPHAQMFPQAIHLRQKYHRNNGSTWHQLAILVILTSITYTSYYQPFFSSVKLSFPFFTWQVPLGGDIPIFSNILYLIKHSATILASIDNP